MVEHANFVGWISGSERGLVPKVQVTALAPPYRPYTDNCRSARESTGNRPVDKRSVTDGCSCRVWSRGYLGHPIEPAWVE